MILRERPGGHTAQLRTVIKVPDAYADMALEVTVRMEALTPGDHFFLEEDGHRLGLFRAMGKPYRLPLNREQILVTEEEINTGSFIWAIEAVGVPT